MITPDSPERLYSTRLRTAVVLTGSGAAGAYHAGVLRALHEAGIRTDLVAGRGIGAAGALFAAIDGGQRLWDPDGLWKGKSATRFYGWRRGLQVAALALLGAAALLLFPLLLFAAAIAVGLAGFLLTLVGLDEAGSRLAAAFTTELAELFGPRGLPTIIPRLVLLMVAVAVAVLLARVIRDALRARARRRPVNGLVWQLLSSPLAVRGTFDALTSELWTFIRGAAPLQQPASQELARRYMELLADNLGQPGFRELLVVAHDVDARHDVVFAFVAEGHRPRFFGRAASPGGVPRAAEAFDLSGVARDHAMDALAASLAVPLATPTHAVTFAREGPWRGETHRLCDRPGALPRVLEEVQAAGAEQVILVAPYPRAARPRELTTPRADLRGDASEGLSTLESAALRDALESFSGRFAGLYVIRPEHNPIGPFDFAGVHDERSDRRYTLGELVDRGYEDAYRQFIDPVVGASGERMQSVARSQ